MVYSMDEFSLKVVKNLEDSGAYAQEEVIKTKNVAKVNEEKVRVCQGC